MEINTWTVYWITRLDGIYEFSIAWAILGVIIGAALILIGHAEDEPEWIKWGKITLPTIIIPILVILFVPTSKEFAAIYLVPKIANSNSAKNVMVATDNATLFLQKKMEEWLKDQIKEK